MSAAVQVKDFIDRGLSLRSAWISLGIGCLFLLLSVSWILFSDRLAAEIAPGREELLLIQQYKGLGFVVVMTLLFGWLVYVLHRRGMVLERALRFMQTDPLTGLANRAVAEDYLSTYLAMPGQHPLLCGVLLFDIRDLSRVNRAVGRSGGDQVLNEVGNRIRKIARPSDLVARLESDRFVIVVGRCTGKREVLEFGTKVRAAFNVPITVDKVEVQVELRGGAALAPLDGNTPFELLDAAERALYSSKKGDHGFGLANREDLLSNAGHLELEGQLRRAIRERQLSIVLQPQVSLNTLELVGAEVLARWHSPGRGEIAPGEFIPLAESLGLIQDITEQVLDVVGDCVIDWRDKGLPSIQICVNLSGLDLKNGRILEVVESFLTRSRLPIHYLTLEITESWLMEDPNRALGLIHRLRDMGPRLAIDDFGTGYSALGQLIDFPFDYVKFDRSFVAGADSLSKKAKLLTAIQRMAATLDMETVAEGVETMNELALVRAVGIDKAQGYLFAGPVPPAVFETEYLTAGQSPFWEIRRDLDKLAAENKTRVTRIRKAGKHH